MQAMKMTITAMTVGLRKRAISAVSASLSTADASRAPAFFTCNKQQLRHPAVDGFATGYTSIVQELDSDVHMPPC